MIVACGAAGEDKPRTADGKEPLSFGTKFVVDRTVSVCLKIQSGLQHIYSFWQLERRGKVWTARVPLPAAEWLSR